MAEYADLAAAVGAALAPNGSGRPLRALAFRGPGVAGLVIRRPAESIAEVGRANAEISAFCAAVGAGVVAGVKRAVMAWPGDHGGPMADGPATGSCGRRLGILSCQGVALSVTVYGGRPAEAPRHWHALADPHWVAVSHLVAGDPEASPAPLETEAGRLRELGHVVYLCRGARSSGPRPVVEGSQA